jgi:hypothetical protein
MIQHEEDGNSLQRIISQKIEVFIIRGLDVNCKLMNMKQCW